MHEVMAFYTEDNKLAYVYSIGGEYLYFVDTAIITDLELTGLESP